MTVKSNAKFIAEFQKTVKSRLKYSVGKNWEDASKRDIFLAVSLAARELIIDKMLETEKRYEKKDAKRLYYLSMEFLMGRSLSNNLHNLGVYELCKDALLEMGVDIDEVRDYERDAALGNGGLGRLAACFLDSIATLGMPGYGCGINYEYGLFKQVIDNGYQKEKPDNWLREETPWQIKRPDEVSIVPIYGEIEHSQDREGNYNPMWMNWKVLIGVPYDMPIVGYGGKTVNYLRLYSAVSSEDFDMEIFNQGDYFDAVKQKITSETISKVLYPSDSIESGRELRLMQEYFFVACSIRDAIRNYEKKHSDIKNFHEKVAIQLNDTHPALAVAELMRILVDEYTVDWEDAWEVTQKTMGYTNHTLLPEALERWSVPLFEKVLPRHLQIIYEINRRYLAEVSEKYPNDFSRLSKISIIEEAEPKQVRMANLAIIGSHSVNGVAALHSELVKSNLVPHFYELTPEKFNNKTNGVTQRRWLLKSNPLLAELITDSIGDKWITNLDELRKLEDFAEKKRFQNKFLKIKKANKEALAKIIKKTARVDVNPDSLFSVQIKRIHEYKRQLLNILHVMHLYFAITEDGYELPVPRTFIFAGKAAPGYFMAKLIIKLINSVAEKVNKDPRVNEVLKVAFIPDYRVTLAESIIPAADLSEQISTAGKEASGTGNMKFSMNGSLTVGTLDGANVEIGEEVGDENIYIFGLVVEEVQRMLKDGTYNTWHYYNSDSNVKRVLDSIENNVFCEEEEGIFLPIHDKLLHFGDEYFHLADFESYRAIQEQISQDFVDSSEWARKAILNVARMGKFSSDRTIKQYADEIWNLKSFTS